MRLVSSVLIALALLTGCSSEDSSTETAPTTPPASSSAPSSAAPPAEDAPDCRSVWKRGEQLPEDFTTCVFGDQAADLETTECQDGSRLVVIGDAVWGRTGQGEIVRAAKKPAQDTDAYNTELAGCTGR